MKKRSVFYYLLFGSLSFLPGLFLFALSLSLPGTIALYCTLSLLAAALIFRFGGDVLLDSRFDRLAGEMEKQGFLQKDTFRSREIMVFADEAGGRVAFLPRRAPFRAQVFSASLLHDIEAVTGEDISGGTRLVFLRFYLGNKKIEVPSFHSGRRSFPLDHPYVQGAQRQAQNYAALLLRTKQHAG